MTRNEPTSVRALLKKHLDALRQKELKDWEKEKRLPTINRRFRRRRNDD